ncbi:shikimate kinase [Pedobacter sp. HMF7647]|uniref:Shikimate kinase n=1 Tax=Hufsiella arboris TaxID=2695275 RepID=A0A7K1Y435_9SPHI|nr:shikimate kinase [Hufsiella arboris]MXV49345.1 shikimate kinase [Hufsiella arboris]
MDSFGKLFLIGFMGCGKTTLGKKLASRLGCDFFDLDHILEKKVGMTIPQFFLANGEDAFRQLEREVLTTTELPDNAVISTGGGLPCYFDNMNWMNSNGTTIYIFMPPAALAVRLDNDQIHGRPALQGKRGTDLIAFIADKLKERESFYNKANLIIRGIDITAEKLVGILQANKKSS